MAGAIEKLRNSLSENVSEEKRKYILEGYDKITDNSKKSFKSDFFINVCKKMDEVLDESEKIKIREVCACCTGGWREKAVKKINRNFSSVEEIISALNEVTHLGFPKLNYDGTITAGIGPDTGCYCACAVFNGAGLTQPSFPVSKTYCYCCAGHFKYLYQFAFAKELEIVEIVSSSLESMAQKPCRFKYRFK